MHFLKNIAGTGTNHKAGKILIQKVTKKKKKITVHDF